MSSASADDEEEGDTLPARSRGSLSLKSAFPSGNQIISSLGSVSGGQDISVRNYSQVEVIGVSVGEPRKETYFTSKKFEEYAMKTWSYPLIATARYADCEEIMQIKGQALRRSLHEILWARSALVAEHPGVIIPPLISDVSGNANLLERWFERCLKHPILQSSAVLKCLALSPPSEFAAAQRAFVADLGSSPPLSIQVSAAFKLGKETFFPDASPQQQDQQEEEVQSNKIKITEESKGIENRVKEKVYSQWISEQTSMLEVILEACQAASSADDDAILKSTRATHLVLTHLAGSKIDTMHHDDLNKNSISDENVYGPQKTIPLLRDLLGFLSAATEAVNGQQSARLKLLAAKDHTRKVIASSKARIEYIEKAANEEIVTHKKQQPTESLTNSTTTTSTISHEKNRKNEELSPMSRAKNVLSHLKCKAVGVLHKTAATISYNDSDVTKAKALQDNLQTHFNTISRTLHNEISALQSEWIQRLRYVFRIYAQAEAARAQFATQLVLSLNTSTPDLSSDL